MNDDLTGLIEQLRAGVLSPEELLRQTLDGAREAHARLNCYLQIRSDLRAPPAPRPSEAPLLWGIPLAVKDNIATAGWVTSAGSKILAENAPEKDAAVVSRLRQAGALLYGKLNMHEFAFGITGINSSFGAVRNPHDLSRLAGGSSSGSAAAVADGHCPASLGTDTGGSVRLPAALCGIVGFKPTRGRISTAGLIPLSPTLDDAGTLTRSVRDAALLTLLLAGEDRDDPVTLGQPRLLPFDDLEEGVSGLRIGFISGPPAEPADPRIVPALRRAMELLAAGGARVDLCELPFVMAAAGAQSAIIGYEAAAYHERWLAERPGDYTIEVLTRLQDSQQVQPEAYSRALEVRSAVCDRMERLMERFDLLALPASRAPAPRIDESRVRLGGQWHTVQQLLVQGTFLFNLTGQPAISTPCGTAAALPVGLQIVGRRWEENLVLRAARVVEKGCPRLTPPAAAE